MPKPEPINLLTLFMILQKWRKPRQAIQWDSLLVFLMKAIIAYAYNPQALIDHELSHHCSALILLRNSQLMAKMSREFAH